MQNIDDAYDLLHEIAHLNMGDTEKYYDKKNVVLISMLWNDLFQESVPAMDSLEEFFEIVSQLNARETSLSRDLGNAILEASDLTNEGRIDDAVKVLQKFISRCTIQSFREIAESQMENLQSR